MLLTREEMTHDWGGATFDLTRDRDLLGWMFNQFLYGEITGIQCGHWLYNAPTLESARFLAKQALEEFQHIDNFLRCLAYLGIKPQAPHRAVRFLSTGMMPETWAEHVALEMAFGEGLVLMCFYALIDTIDHPEIVAILSRAVKQEETHVEFGERETQLLVKTEPALARRLGGLSLVSLWAVRRLTQHLKRMIEPGHPVLSQLDGFVAQVMRASELRLDRLGLIDRPLAAMSTTHTLKRISEAYLAKALHRLTTLSSRWLPIGGPRRLTETYLSDPSFLRATTDAQVRVQTPKRGNGQHHPQPGSRSGGSLPS